MIPSIRSIIDLKGKSKDDIVYCEITLIKRYLILLNELKNVIN